eukprot:Nk52_evm1s615 gene=Nk52_evmTU1s615
MNNGAVNVDKINTPSTPRFNTPNAPNQNRAVSLTAGAQMMEASVATSGTSSAPVRNSRSNFKPSKPEKYDGTESRTTAHLFEIHQYLAWCDLTSDDERIRAASTYLTGQASLWYRNTLAEAARRKVTPFASFDDYCMQLEKAHVILEPTCKTARDKLASWKQRTSVNSAIREFLAIKLELPTVCKRTEVESLQNSKVQIISRKTQS